MLSKNTIKLINSLAYKKYRTKEKLFIVEGDKNITELLENNQIVVKEIFVTDHFTLPKNFNNEYLVKSITDQEIRKISQLKNPQNSLAVCEIPDHSKLPKEIEGLSFYLDGIQDPGNLGTILRVCDWFDVKHLYCSNDTVDLYNPKSIQASMGSYARVKVYYTDFETLTTRYKNIDTFLIAADMDGENLYDFPLQSNSLIVLGNEGNGVGKNILKTIETKVSIPRFGGAESLNVGVAAAIFGSEYCRKFKQPYSK